MVVVEVLARVVGDVWALLLHSWAFLLISAVAAAALPVYVGAERLRAWLSRRVLAAVLGAVALATLTPFCSCGTTAVVLGALAAHVPWAPVVAFMVASPLTSPAELTLSIGLFGGPFATLFFVGTIVLGLAAGGIAHLVERTGWLAGQARMPATGTATSCVTDTGSSCSLPTAEPSPAAAEPAPCCGDAPALGGSAGTRTGLPIATAIATVAPVATRQPVHTAPASLVRRWQLDVFARELVTVGRRLAVYFVGFAALGHLLIETIPTHWLTGYLGGDSPLAVPMAAVLGIPVYLNTDASLPLVATLMQGGMGAGPAMAFLVTGAGTSIGATSGMLLIARGRVVGLVVGLLFAGALALGGLADLLL
jgi:uncharacterized membrane protein YraQ (UPF0718 family)